MREENGSPTVDAFPILTPEEAKARLPSLRPLLSRLRDRFHAYRFAKEQVDELVEMNGPAIADETHPDNAEAQRWRRDMLSLKAEVHALVGEINSLGADVKDPILGLVDFYTQRGNDHVLLCYRDDEPTITHWHPVDTGFSSRRPLEEL